MAVVIIKDMIIVMNLIKPYKTKIMKKGSRFLIGLATAGITFGTLMFTLGQGQFNKYGRGHCGGYHHMHQCQTEQPDAVVHQ